MPPTVTANGNIWIVNIWKVNKAGCRCKTSSVNHKTTKSDEQPLLLFPLSTVVLILFIPKRLSCSFCSRSSGSEQQDESEGQVSPSMCLALRVQVELLWLGVIREGPAIPRNFSPGVLLLNNPGHTIAGELIRAHERMEEEMIGGGGEVRTLISKCNHDSLFLSALPALLSPSPPLSLSLSLSKLPSDWMTVR